jgi:hypothetical protein
MQLKTVDFAAFYKYDAPTERFIEFPNSLLVKFNTSETVAFDFELDLLVAHRGIEPLLQG